MIMTGQQRADVSKREGFELDTTPFLHSLATQLTGQEYPEDGFDNAYAEHGFGGLHYTADDDYSAYIDGLSPAIGFDRARVQRS